MEENGIYLEKEKEFIEGLKEIEEVQTLRKMKKINILIYILLIIIIPTIAIVGFWFSAVFLYIIAGIILLVGIIYTSINNVKSKKIVKSVMVEKIESFFREKYNIITLSEEMKEEICEKSAEEFARNNEIEKLNRTYGEVENEHIIRFVKEGKEVDVFLYEETEHVYKNQNLHICNFVLVAKVEENEIFYLACKDKDFVLKKNRMNYDKIFWNQDEDIKILLKEDMEELKEIKFVKINEEQRKKLVEIYNKYPNNFKILIRDGYIYIKIGKCIDNNVKTLEGVFDFQNCLNDLLLNFI